MPRTATLRRYKGYWFSQAGSRQGTYFGRIDEVPYQEAKRRFGEFLAAKKHQKQYGLPNCVQKYFESQESNYSDTFLKGFAGAKSIAQLETLSPEQLFASWLAGGDAVKSNERSTTRTIIGEVTENEYVTHVIYRMSPTPPGTSDDGVERITVRRYNGEWHVVPNDDIRLAGRSYSWQSGK